MPTAWSLERWYRKRFWKSDVVTEEILDYGTNKTVRLYPWSTSGDQTQLITIESSDSKKWWTVTNRQPIGVDRGLVYDNGPGQTGIVVAYNDSNLKGRMELKGPVRIRDSHPGTVPDYAHFSCRSDAHDGAFNIGEVDSYSEGSMSVELLEEHDDGSITVLVSTGSTSAAVSKKQDVQSFEQSTVEIAKVDMTPIAQAQQHKESSHSDHTHHASLALEVTGATAPVAKARLAKSKNHSLAAAQSFAEPTTSSSGPSTVYSDEAGDYDLTNVANSDWHVKVEACGFAVAQQQVSVTSNTTLDFTLTEDSNRVLTSVISSPSNAGTYTGGQSMTLDATSSQVFGQSSFTWESSLDGQLSTKASDSVNLSLGAHTITLTVANDLCDSTTSVNLDVIESDEPVNVLPVADFTVVTSNLSASFTDESADSDGSVSVWAWDFGDGNTSTQISPSHTYASAGDYTVSLTVTDGQGGQASKSEQITVTASTSNNPNALEVGVAKSPIVVGYQEELHYHINIPAGVSNMTIALSGDGDGDLYVKLGAEPTRDYQGADYKSAKWKSNDSITIESPAQGTWYIMVYGYKAMTTGSLQVDFN